MIVIVAGVSGSGKTTVGELLASRLSWAFVDGDSLHSKSNVAKMAAGTPLTDADRMPWLRAIGDWMDEQLERGRVGDGQPGVVACSALKRRYRDELLSGRPAVSMAFLLIDEALVRARLAARHGHFFDADLLGSQFAALEPPGADEDRVFPVPIGPNAGPTDLVNQIMVQLGLAAQSRADSPPQPPTSLFQPPFSPPEPTAFPFQPTTSPPEPTAFLPQPPTLPGTVA